MSKTLALLLVLGTLIATPVFSKTVWVLRHAETTGAPGDAELSPRGFERAQAVADLIMADAAPELLMSTRYNRTTQTVDVLSTRSGAPLEFYDPRLGNEMDLILGSDAAVIVVAGHSNTVAALVASLGGEPGLDLDQSEYDRLYRLTLGEDGKATQTQLLRTDPAPDRPPIAPLPVKFADIRAGTMTFDVTSRSGVTGEVVWTYGKEDSTVRLTEVRKSEAPAGTIESHVTLSAITEPAGKLTTTGTFAGKPVDIEAIFSPDGITGHSAVQRAFHQPQGKVTVALKGGAIERLAALMLGDALPIDDMPLAFEWFNAAEVGRRTIVAQYEGPQTITVPAGTFETDLILLSGGAPSVALYVTREAPRMTVRVDFIHQPASYELRAFASD